MDDARILIAGDDTQWVVIVPDAEPTDEPDGRLRCQEHHAGDSGQLKVEN